MEWFPVIINALIGAGVGWCLARALRAVRLAERAEAEAKTAAGKAIAEAGAAQAINQITLAGAHSITQNREEVNAIAEKHLADIELVAARIRTDRAEIEQALKRAKRLRVVTAITPPFGGKH